MCFNPRTREGATGVTDQEINVENVSIHAPVRVRLTQRGAIVAGYKFQSTHP